MSDERKPPKIEDAPGIVLRPRKSGWTVRWHAQTDLVTRGYKPKSLRLAIIGEEPTADERAFISHYCQTLQQDMRHWAGGALPALPGTFDGTVAALAESYTTDPDSGYHKQRFRSRKHTATLLKVIVAEHGAELIADLRARAMKRWYEAWSERGIPMAHALMGQLRTILTFGSTFLDDADCRALKVTLHDMKFAMGKPRTSTITAEQIDGIRAAAIRDGSRGVALAQSFQFDCTLRQKDVIGEWVPQSEPGISDTLRGNEKWLRGLRWEEIDAGLVLRHVTSKRQKLITVPLLLAPRVMEELKRAAPGLVSDTGAVNRALLPASGPVILAKDGYPFLTQNYRYAWRQCATAVGVPLTVRNMDTRAGAITEGLRSGASLDSARKMATHSTVEMTQRYSREDEEEIAEVMRLRSVKYPNKTGTQ